MRRPILWLAAVSLVLAGSAARAETRLLNVSYDPTRELYRDINRAFIAAWQAKTGQRVIINPTLTELQALLDQSGVERRRLSRTTARRSVTREQPLSAEKA